MMVNSISSVIDAGVRSDWKNRIVETIPPNSYFSENITHIVDRIRLGIPLSKQDGIQLYNHPKLSELAILAHASKQARFGNEVYYNRNLHVNQTNICTLACRFCAFRRGKKSVDAYALSIESYIERIHPYAKHIDEIHTVGGLHPDWDVDYYAELFKSVKSEFPDLHIKALTAVEIKHLSIISEMSVQDVLSTLHTAGLDSIPGGGAEILDDSVRDIICRGKESSDEYLMIHQTAHELNIPSNCTMLFGTIETVEQRISHLIQLRDLQSKTNGFQCFVPYPYLRDNSRLPQAQLSSGHETLRMIAISRLMLDNIPHIKAYRMNIGEMMSELALVHGADDIDGTVIHEEIMQSAGSHTPLGNNRSSLIEKIRSSNAIPVLRNSIYTKFTYDDGDDYYSPIKLPIEING
jgi:aminodeoxyfutalosine synthase